VKTAIKVVEAAGNSTRFGSYNYNILKKLDFLSSQWIIEKSVVSVNPEKSPMVNNAKKHLS
jgi:hypothetical protein